MSVRCSFLSRINSDNLSNRAAATGNPPQPGSLGEGTQNYPHAITDLVPRPVSSLGFAVNSRAQQRELFIDVREFATGFFLGCFVTLAAILLCIGFIGYRALIA